MQRDVITVADIVELGGDIFQLDLEECGCKGRTAGYFVRGKEGWLLVEAGPATSAGIVSEATRQLGIKPEHLKYIAATHIHLDHAGGLGVLADRFKNARIVLHPKGARHMIDPSKLIAGALKDWGKEKMEQFGEVLPVPEERIINAGEGDIVDLGDRKIEIWETPGHAKNHLCFYDVKTLGVFSGDAAGVYSPGLSGLLQRPVVRPATPAPDFNGDLMVRSLIRLALSGVEQVYFTHFGLAQNPHLLLENVLGQLAVYMELGRKIYQKEQGNRCRLAGEIKKYLRGCLLGKKERIEGLDGRAEQEWEFMVNTLDLSAEGILHYLKKFQDPHQN